MQEDYVRKRISLKTHAPLAAVASSDSSFAAGSERGEAGLDLVGACRTLIAGRRTIFGVTFAFIAITAAIVAFIPNSYRSTASILPSGGSDKLSGLSSLAGLTGMVVTDEQSSQLFPVILESRVIRQAMLSRLLTFIDDGKEVTMTLESYLGPDDSDGLLKRLSDMTSMSMNKKSGVIHLSVDSRIPDLSRAVAALYLTELEIHNVVRRQSEAKNRVAYLSRELPARTAELEAAEDSLSAFRQANSNWVATSDPELLMLLGRLQRDVAAKERTVSYLRQELEAARLEVQKDIPVVRVLDYPMTPTRKTGPRRTLIVLLMGILGAALAVAGVLAHGLYVQRRDAETSSQFEHLEQEARKAFPRASRLVHLVRSKGTVWV